MQKDDRDGVEWPTLALLVLCYALWAVGTTWAAALSLPLGMAVTLLGLVLHSSLQHEVLHGHPFRNPHLNHLLVFLPVGLAFPYGRFRDTHLDHHRDEHLTDPYDDPETNFLDPKVWARLSRPVRALLRFNNTLFGRMLVGPAIGYALFLRADLAAIRAGNRRVLRDWLLHGAGLALVALWLSWASMPFWAYLVSAYGALSVLKIRTYLEHRAHDIPRGRSVIVERGGILGFLFLNNNLHALHHARPKVAWYRLPGLYRDRRDELLRRNDGYHYRSYGQIFRAYFLRAKDPVPHPLRPQD